MGFGLRSRHTSGVAPFVEPPYGDGWAGGLVHLADAEPEQFLSEADAVERSEVSREGQRAEGHVCLVDHEQAFPLSTGLNPALLHPCRPVPADPRNALMMLDADELRSILGDHLTEDQIDAVLKRRDRDLEVCGSPEASSLVAGPRTGSSG